MKRALPIIFILIGAALLITAVIFLIDSNNSTTPQNLGQSLRDWITLLAGLGASVKGWIDLVKGDPQSTPTQSNSVGGVVVSGKIETIGKDVIGRDQIVTTNIFSVDSPYNVEGLLNPYLGLQAFTYNERNKYAGRERLTEEALHLLVSSSKKNLLFVTGASGSGKSSFVQASLLPALVDYFQSTQGDVGFEVFRPSQSPIKRLNQSLKRLGSRKVQLIIIDQFEELFTQSVPNERDALFRFLKKLEPFDKSQRIVLATLRSDYLGEMFDFQWLWEIAKQGVELREMRIQELKDAIVRPLQVKYPNGNKKIELELVEKLAVDTAESVTYLPLLQVTLEEIWNKGELRLSSYNLLTDAIKERANTVLNYQDFDKASPSIKRIDAEREEIIEILLDMVNPSLDNNLKHDVRISRKLSDFDRKQKTLIRDLSKARLVSINIEEGVEVVNLIHETLIHSWDVLSDGIKQKRIQLQKRVRFEEHLRAWIANNKADDYLLSKGQLTEAMELKQHNDISLQSKNGSEFFKNSELNLENETKRAELYSDMEGRIQGMNALTRVTKGVNVTLTFDDVLELIYAQTTQIIPTSHFHITLYNKDSDYYYHGFCLENNERIDEKENQPFSADTGLGPDVIRKSHPIMTQDYIRECQARGHTPALDNVFAWMGVPLNAGAATFGTLSIGNRDSSISYTRGQLELLQAIADQTAGAIVKARLLEETEQRARQLSTLNEIAKQLTSTLELNPLLQYILKNAVDILNCEAGSLFLVDEQTEELVFHVIEGPVVSNLIGKRLPPGTGIVGKAVQNRSAVIENEDQITKNRLKSVDQQTGFVSRSLLAMPLQVKDRVIGVIEVINRRDGLPIVQNDVEVLSAFAGQAAVAIENARLYTLTDVALAERVYELSIMQRIDRELNAKLDVDRVMRITLDWALRQSGAEAGLIGILEEEDSKLRVMAHQGLDEQIENLPYQTMKVELSAMIAAVETGAPQQASVEASKNKLLAASHSQMVIPIRRETTVIGLLYLESLSDTQVDIDFLTRLTDHAAIAISNAQLYEQAINLLNRNWKD